MDAHLLHQSLMILWLSKGKRGDGWGMGVVVVVVEGTVDRISYLLCQSIQEERQCVHMHKGTHECNMRTPTRSHTRAPLMKTQHPYCSSWNVLPVATARPPHSDVAPSPADSICSLEVTASRHSQETPAWCSTVSLPY